MHTVQESWEPLGPTSLHRSSRSARYSFTLSTSSALNPRMLLAGTGPPFAAAPANSARELLQQESFRRELLGSTGQIHKRAGKADTPMSLHAC